MEHKITDNFLDEEDFIQIKKLMLESATFPWYLNRRIINGDNPDGMNFQFTHTFFGNWRWQSDFGNSIAPLLDKINPKAWLRVKANLGPVASEIKEQGYHVDYEFPCTTAVFYLNTNNGYTIFEDGTKVESVANRLVEFDSHHKHSGTTHTDTAVRSVINLNYFKDGGR